MASKTAKKKATTKAAPQAAPKLAPKGAPKAAPKPAAKPSARPAPKPAPRPAPPPPPPPKAETIEERTAALEARLLAAPTSLQDQYRESLDMSWIFHDAALEGVVYTYQELQTALDPASATAVLDSSIQPICEEIRRHRDALNYVREMAVKRRVPITVDVIRKIYLILHPEEGDLKTVKYRKDIPQHRLYFHEYAPPDKITYKVRQIVDWLNDPETKKARTGLRVAARAHYDLVRVFPFATDSGKVARLLLNMLLLRSGYPPAIVHATERQRYYEALKGSSAAMTQIILEAIENNLGSVEKMLDNYDRGGRIGT